MSLRPFPALVLVTSLLLGAFAPAAADEGAGGDLPPNFLDEPVLSGLDQPVFLTTLPDGRMLVVQKAGTILRFDPAVLPATATEYLTIPGIRSDNELGVTGLVLDPGFATNGHFYVYYAHETTARHRLSRFTEVGGVGDPASEIVLWVQTEQIASCCHHGGGLALGPDGCLYLTTGEDFDGAVSQDLTLPGGKILRFNTDGTVPADNPFHDGAGPNLDAIWALGLRNPYRAHWDQVTGRLYVAEVGGNVQSTAMEDLHLGAAGANYGWPFCEGDCANVAYSDPVYTYPHTGATPVGGAIVGGFTYWGSQYPSSYLGAYVFADYAQDWIGYVTFDPVGQVIDFVCLTDDVDSVVGLAQGPEGAVYYAEITGEVRRITYVDPSGNQPPSIGAVSASPDRGPEPLLVSFAATVTDLEDDELTYDWTFGDGATATGNPVQHLYTQVGEYEAFLKVSDGSRTTVSERLPIQVGDPPKVKITSPVDGDTFRALDVIHFAGAARDVENGRLLPDALSWTVRFLHNAHTHPVLNDYVGAGGSFLIEDSGHDYFDDTGYELILTATGADGLRSTDRVEIRPEKVVLRITTEPKGLPVLLDGVSLPTPIDYDTALGFRHTFAAPASFCVEDQRYEFVGWSDGGAATHEVLVVDDQRLTATYAPAGPCGTSIPQAGLVLHLEADQGVVTSGDDVLSWSDQSTFVNPLTAAGAPTFVPDAGNGLPAISFDGVDDSLERAAPLNSFPSGNARRTMFVVAKYDSNGWGGTSYGSVGSCNSVFGLAVSGSTGNLAVQHFCSDFVSPVPGNGAGWLVQSAVLDGTALRHFRNGVLIDSRTHFYETGVDSFVIGAELDGAPHLDMDVAAVLLYDRALTESERLLVEQYLQYKWLGAGANQPPVADDDVVELQQGRFVSIDVLDGDVDPEGSIDPWSIQVLTPPEHGSAVLLPDNTVHYQHDGTENFTDSFTYTVRDVLGAESNVATVSITITPASANLPPTPDDDEAQVLVGGSVAIDVLDGDTDPEGPIDETSIVIQAPPANGTATVNADDTVQYTHDGSATASDTFTYTVKDLLGAESAPATVTVTVLDGGVIPSGLVLHLDAATGVLESGGVVTSWQDLSAAGNDLTALGAPTLGATGPVGLPAVALDGFDDVLVGTSSGFSLGNADRTMYAVVTYQSVGWGGVTYGVPACNQAFGLAVSSTGNLAVQHWCADFVTGAAGAGAGWLVQSVVHDGGQMTHYLDGTQIDARTKTYATGPGDLRIGTEIDGAPYVQMQVAEVLVYDRALSPAERGALDQYFQDKYQLR